MNLLIVPKPLFTDKMVVEAYYMASQYGNAILESTKSNPFDRAMDSPFIDFMEEVGLDALTQRLPVFIPITQIQLLTPLNEKITEETEKVILLLRENVVFDDLAVEQCKRFSEMGFRLAAYYRGNADAILPVKPYLEFIFLYDTPAEKVVDVSVEVYRSFPHATVVAPDIPKKKMFEQIGMHSGSQIELYGGAFYKAGTAKNTKQNALSPLKTNYIQLLNIVSQEDFDFQTFTRTIRQDTALAIQFMRLVNTSSKAHQEIKNFNQAAAMLGQKEIKKWVSTAVSNALCVDSPSEITRLSLLRAKFCENLAHHFGQTASMENLFLMGLFSVLGVILEIPIEDALKMVFVPTQIHNALLKQEGDYYSVLYFVQQYELGHWKEISRVALVRDISIDQIHHAYKEALLWYSNLINSTITQSEFE